MMGAVADQPEHFYTVDEANALTDHLREVLDRVREARDTIVSSAERISEGAVADGGGQEGSAAWEAARILRREVEALSARGIILRDTDTGLFDFPSRREGRTVYLCWKPDEEDRVSFWHEINAGFPGRKRL
jgi:hypothetical protein